MNSASKTMRSIHYPRSTIERAERAVRCAPFLPPLFDTMRWQSVDLRVIAGTAGVANHYTRRPIAELTAESQLLWLMQVGLLRREVDGQGLTDSFRLTPLGRQLVEKWQQQGGTWAGATLFDRFINVLSRWVRLPSWL
jgi:hypothetical protein